MKRYYLDSLNLFQSIIKAIIINLLLTILIVLVFVITGFGFIVLHLYLFITIYMIVFIYQIIKASKTYSFYIKDNAIYYCVKNKEIRIDPSNITKVEEYFGIDYLFKKKTIIIHVNSKSYNFIFEKTKADKFMSQLIEYINEIGELREFNL